MSKIWMICIWILVLVILGFMWWPSKEGFSLQEPTTFDALRNFFHYQFPAADAKTAIPVSMSPGVAALIPNMDASIFTPGFAEETQSLTRLLYDGRDPNLDEDAKCRAIAHPKYLTDNRAQQPAKQIAAGQGCGWWFVADPAIPSVGTFGTKPEAIVGKPPVVGRPMYPTSLPPGGRWIWDAAAAEQAETIKGCKAIATCSLLSGSTERCGFCPSKGYAVPVDEQGAVRYTQDDDGNCADASRIVTDPKGCHLLTVPPQDYSGDFDYDMNGNPIRNQKYFDLTNPQGLTIPDPCELIGGYLSKECRLRMCKELGHCQEGKGMHRIVGQEGNLSETDQVALFYVKKYGGLEIPPVFWLPVGKGTPLAKTDAEYLMERLYAIATSGPPSRGRSAALWFLNETPFNVCDFEEGDQEDFPLQCIQREFRKGGCQAAGFAYPNSTTLFKGMTYGAIRTQFRDLYDKMSDAKVVKNVREQDDAVKACLGIEMQRTTDETFERNPNPCREPGVEYWFTTIPTVGQRLLYARRITGELVTESGPLGAEFRKLLNAQAGVRGFTVRGYTDLSGTPTSLYFRAPVALSRFYSLWINGVQVLPQVGTGGAEFQASIPTYRRSEVEIRYEGTGADLGFGDPQLTLTPNTPLYLAQSPWKPLISLRASSAWVDENRYMEFASVATQTYGTRQGVALRGTYITSKPSRGIWFPAVRSIAAMYYLESADGQAPLWRFDQGTGGLGDTGMKLTVQEQRLVFTVQSGTSIFEVRSSETLGARNRWMHVGVVVGDQFVRSRLYLDGRDVTGSQPKATGVLNPDTESFSRLVLGGAGFQGAIGWFHVYDTALGSAEVARDKEYDNPLYSDKEAQGRTRQFA